MYSSGVTASVLTFAGTDYNKQPANGMLARAVATSAAGFSGMGVSLKEPIDPSVLAHTEISEIEWVELSEEVDDAAERAVALSARLGGTRLHAGVCVAHHIPWDTIVGRLHTLADTGLHVALEPVAFGSLSSVYDVQSIVDIVDRDSVGILYDLWHVHHESPAHRWSPPSEPGRVKAVQVCGIPAWGTVAGRRHILAASQDRPYISDSAVNVSDWVKFLRDKGVTAPLAYENPVRGASIRDQVAHAKADLLIL